MSVMPGGAPGSSTSSTRISRGPCQRSAFTGSGPASLDRTSAAEVTRDHQMLDFVRSLADLEDLRVAVEPGHRVIVHVAIAAVDLYGFRGGPDGQAGRQHLGHCGLLGERTP